MAIHCYFSDPAGLEMAAKVVKTVNEELPQQEALALLQKVQSSSLSYVR